MDSRGHASGELMGIPPTGKRIQFGGISIYRLSEGKIAEHSGQMDSLDFARQPGMAVIPGLRLLMRMLVRQAKKLRSRPPAGRSG